jgi:hypothetical protein
MPFTGLEQLLRYTGSFYGSHTHDDGVGDMKMKRAKRERGWAIVNDECGFYVGWHHSRNGAIGEHVNCLRGSEETASETWARCRRNGDRAVKITIALDRRTR